MAFLTGWFYYNAENNSGTFVADNPDLYPVAEINWELLEDPEIRKAFITHFNPSQFRQDGRIKAFFVEWEEADIIRWLNEFG